MNNAPSFLNSMNMGGGAASSGNKSARLLAGLREEITKLQPYLDKVVQATGKIAENLTKAKGAGSLGFSGTGGNFTSLGFATEGSGMSFGSFARGMARAAAVVGTAATQALDLQDFSENAIARQRFGFFSGQGIAGASMTFQGMMNQGTAIDRMDAVRAGMMGASMGLMPGMPGYSTVAGGAATFSNLVPGAGLAGGMQAMAALNQGSSVNRLRMIGIQVRDPATGTMRSPEAIAGDLWNKLNAQKSGTKNISKQDIAFSLQSGNSLDMMLSQYFGNDPVLRQGIVTALMQKASGGSLSKESLNETGALPDLAVSTGQRNAASFGALDAYTGAAEQGIMGANATIAAAANTMRDSAEIFSGAVTAFTFGMQLSGGAGGAFGTLGGAALGGIANLGGSFLGNMLASKGGAGLGGLFGRGAAGAGAGRARALGGGIPGGARFSPAVRGLGVVGAGLGAVNQFQGAQAGEGFDWGSALLTSALTGLSFSGGNPFVGLGVGLGSFAVQAGAHMLGGGSLFGEGDGADGQKSSRFNPLEELRVNAAWRKKRDYLIDGKPPANPYHTGVDYGVAENTQVFAVKDGVVVSAKDAGNRGFGKSVAIKHGDGYTSFYAHLNAHGVKAGDNVKAGQVIGLSGNTGLSSGPHLHFEVRENANDQSTNVDPVAYISGAARPKRASEFNASGATNEESAAETKSLLGSLSSGIALVPGLSGAPAPGGEGDGGGISATTNYGGVTVNINVPKGTNINEQSLAKEIKRVLSDQDMLKRAVTR